MIDSKFLRKFVKMLDEIFEHLQSICWKQILDRGLKWSYFVFLFCFPLLFLSNFIQKNFLSLELKCSLLYHCNCQSVIAHTHTHSLSLHPQSRTLFLSHSRIQAHALTKHTHFLSHFLSAFEMVRECLSFVVRKLILNAWMNLATITTQAPHKTD